MKNRTIYCLFVGVIILLVCGCGSRYSNPLTPRPIRISIGRFFGVDVPDLPREEINKRISDALAEDKALLHDLFNRIASVSNEDVIVAFKEHRIDEDGFNTYYIDFIGVLPGGNEAYVIFTVRIRYDLEMEFDSVGIGELWFADQYMKYLDYCDDEDIAP